MINSNEVREMYKADEEGYVFGGEIGGATHNQKGLTETQMGLDKYLISHSAKFSPA